MKLILFYAPTFWFKTYKKVLTEVVDAEKEASCEKAIVVFYHVEAEDECRRSKVLTKFIKNIKWLAGKFDSRTVVLHSFNHLSESKASSEFAQSLIDEACARLERTQFRVTLTPFGYLNEWKIHVAGDSLAKVFKAL